MADDDTPCVCTILNIQKLYEKDQILG
jgi:hypothetical protein